MVTIVSQLLNFPYETAVIQNAAACLGGGGLVAFPTETVYGLGALALDEQAVTRIFSAKGRPASDPLIVHLHEPAQVAPLVAEFPPLAERLASEFWPGPLTLVLPKSDRVPGNVTAGGTTVALRIPDHPVALALLEAAGAPIAAPSANRFGRLSPTRAEHVLAELGGRIEILLDGGPTGYGLESTVLDLTSKPPRILRPGAITWEQLQRIDARIQHGYGSQSNDPPKTLRSPGLLPAHYAPRTDLWLASGPRAADHLEQECQRRQREDQKVGWLLLKEDQDRAVMADEAVLLGSEADPVGCAQRLYHAMRALDESALSVILARELPERGLGRAINDRLRRAAQGRPDLPDDDE